MASFEADGARVGRLVEEKNTAYGDSVAKTGQMLGIMCPDGIPPDKMIAAGLVVRILDKLMRIMAGDWRAFGESPFDDIAGYALLGSKLLRSSTGSADDDAAGSTIPIPDDLADAVLSGKKGMSQAAVEAIRRHNSAAAHFFGVGR